MIAILAGVIRRKLGQSETWVLEDEETYKEMKKPWLSDRAAFDTLYLIDRT